MKISLDIVIVSVYHEKAEPENGIIERNEVDGVMFKFDDKPVHSLAQLCELILTKYPEELTKEYLEGLK